MMEMMSLKSLNSRFETAGPTSTKSKRRNIVQMENATALMKQTNESGGISVALESLIKHWLVRLAALYDRELSSVIYTIWTDALKDQGLDVLACAFRKLERTFTPTAAAPFPTPAHLLELITRVRYAANAENAEKAWHDLLERSQRQFHPDIGWKGPGLDPRTDRAGRAAGGIRRICGCRETELVWCKKAFIECYLRDYILEEDQNLLPVRADISSRIKNLAERKSLPTADPVKQSSSADAIRIYREVGNPSPSTAVKER
jgi:hypothetical protein